MEHLIQNSPSDLTFRKPKLSDGHAIYQLIKSCPPLDLNSSYLYFLQASHFSDTCIVVEQENITIGFLSAYYQPDKPQSLFVWQVAIAKSARGRGLAKAMLLALLKNQSSDSVMTELTCTISPSNKASQGLFSSFAKTHGLILQTLPFINESHFGDENHEAEDLYILNVASNTKLIPYLFSGI
jgi:L-2,4-diaminobutyric acid acetyltransferase